MNIPKLYLNTDVSIMHGKTLDIETQRNIALIMATSGWCDDRTQPKPFSNVHAIRKHSVKIEKEILCDLRALTAQVFLCRV